MNDVDIMVCAAETESDIHSIEQVILSLYDMDSADREGPLLADSVEKVGHVLAPTPD